MPKIKLLLLLSILALTAGAQHSKLDAYNISWDTPGMNALGSMPLGNGDIGLNAWVEGNGDLVFYLSKTDAWSENAQLLKLGKVRVSVSPDPYREGKFVQVLQLRQGAIDIQYGEASVRLWVDANHPTVQVDIESKKAVNVKVTIEPWRKARRQIKGAETHALYGVTEQDTTTRGQFVYQEADTLLKSANNQIGWYHHNRYSHWPDNLALLSLDSWSQHYPDPLLHRTFGAIIDGTGMVSETDTSLVSQKAARSFQINIYAATTTGTAREWQAGLQQQAAIIKENKNNQRWQAHEAWWAQFWHRSFIFISGRTPESQKEAETVTRGYILQRFMNACGGRGNAPIKFNGSIFTVDNFLRTDRFKGYDADYRQWGSPYWWQNTRLPYWGMLMTGDFDMMRPMLDMYMQCLPIRKQATQVYYQHEGAFFPETMNFWGTHTSANYGFNRKDLPPGLITNNYIKYYWTSGLELSLMMLDCYAFTQSTAFARDTLVPFVSEILTFFDQHWKRGADGKIFFSPAMALETYHRAVNPLPEIAGISMVAQKMLRLPGTFTTASQRAQWTKLLNDLPAMPMRVAGKDTVLAPAAEFYEKANVENPELYAVFPFRNYGVGKPGLDMAKNTFAIRAHKENGGWQQNSIQAACLGLAEEARRMVTESYSTWDKLFRFPAFWGPNYDWTPDQDHGNVPMIALQRMLLQYEEDTVYLTPAWPKDWDAEFRLKGPGNTTIDATVKQGKLEKINISPANHPLKVVAAQ